MSKTTLSAEMKIQKLRLMVHLGVPAPERVETQPVDIDVVLEFSTLPGGCLSDSIDETICYGTLADEFRKEIAGKEYKLIEKLAHDLFAVTKRMVSSLREVSRVEVAVVKVNAPVEGLRDGVRFVVRDGVDADRS